MRKFNDILKDLRSDLEPKRTQKAVGESCGISQRKLSFIESGKTEPNLDDLRALCLYYNVSADFLLDLPDLPYPKR